MDFCSECKEEADKLKKKIKRLQKDLSDVAYALASVGCNPVKKLGPQVKKRMEELQKANNQLDLIEQEKYNSRQWRRIGRAH